MGPTVFLDQILEGPFLLRRKTLDLVLEPGQVQEENVEIADRLQTCRPAISALPPGKWLHFPGWPRERDAGLNASVGLQPVPGARIPYRGPVARREGVP